MAVGADSTTAMVAAERWDGPYWHRLSIPSPPGVSGVELDGVSCPSAIECVAVGFGQDKSGNTLPVAETWTYSGGWTASLPMVPLGSDWELNGVSCPSASLCYAAGGSNEFAPADGDQSPPLGQLPLAERWTPRGGWVRMALPTLPGSVNNFLLAISCASATRCAAVGSYYASPGDLTGAGLIEQLKGSGWRVSAAPKSADGDLEAVSCPSASLCVAVGSLGVDRTLAERWSGGTWMAATPPSPPVAEGPPGLTGVSCASAAHCVAVGGTETDAFVDTLNGTTWTMTAQGGPGFNVGLFNAVSCFPTSVEAVRCAAVGNTIPVAGNSTPLTAFLTGGKWSIVFNP
jgi:hypothetical protein